MFAWARVHLALLLIPLVILAMPVASRIPMLASPGIIFKDDFNRADSNTVGNGWTEIQAGDATWESITSNALKLGRSGVNLQGGVYQTVSPSRRRFQVRGAWTPTDTANRNVVVSMFMVNGLGAANNGTGFQAVTGTTNNVALFPATYNTTLTSASFTITSGTQYWYWMVYTPNGASNWDVSLYLSTTSTKPGSATVSATNLAPPAGTNLFIGIDSNANMTYSFDYIYVEYV